MRRFMFGLFSAICGLSLLGTGVTAQPPREGDRPAGQLGDRGPGDRGRGDRGRGERGPGDRGPGDRGPGDRGPGDRGPGDREQGGRGFGGPGGQGGPGGMRMMLSRLPIMAALDADSNGEISATEMEAAVAALKKLDKNGDGKLTMEELMPEGPMAGPGGPGGFGGGPGGLGVDTVELVNRMFESDKNKDGFVDKDEAPERMQPMFARADIDKDGKLSKDEITKAVTMMGRRGGEGGRPGGEGGQRAQRPESDK